MKIESFDMCLGTCLGTHHCCLIRIFEPIQISDFGYPSDSLGNMCFRNIETSFAIQLLEMVWVVPLKCSLLSE